jgi:peptidyl-prolyl cis-trans isomerase A (cyclophilin A)
MRTILVLAVSLVAGPAFADATTGAADPVASHVISLEDATKGVRGSGTLTAKLEIEQSGKSLGSFTCELFEKQTPKTVANFVGLARGERPFKDVKSGEWVKRPFYNGLTFHRVIPGFMIQGGDPKGTGTGDPGYEFADELDDSLKMDKGGVLAMANRGPGTNGSQFFITEKETPWLNGKHTIFGSCDPVALVTKITGVPKGPRDVPNDPVLIKKVTISRSATKAKKEKKAE